MRPSCIRVLLVDDALEVRDRIREEFEGHREFAIAAEASTVADAIALMGETEPDVVLLDLGLPDGSGLEVLNATQGVARRPLVIVLTNTDDAEVRRRCLSLGAHAVLDKASDSAFLPARVARVFGIALQNDALFRRTDAEAAVLARALKMEMLGQFAIGLVHDLNNALTAMAANAELMDAWLAEEGVPARPETAAIARSARSAAVMLQRLLSFAKSADTPIRPVDLARTVGEMVHLLQGVIPKSIQLRVESDGPVMVMGDTVAIENAVANLVHNARDAIDGVGEIVVQVRRGTAGDGAIDRPTMASLVVRDSGRGIGAAALPHVFTPFYSTKEKGTGLGMYMVRLLAERSGGRVAITSELDGGTTVRVWLPLANPTA